MNFVALQMLLGDRAKYLGLIFAVIICFSSKVRKILTLLAQVKVKLLKSKPPQTRFLLDRRARRKL